MDGTEKTTKKEATVKTDTSAKAKKSAKKAKAKVVKEPKAPREAKSQKEKAPKEPQVVFAFRLTEAQRDAIHNAAGPGKATRFVRTAALAAASGDRAGFEGLLVQAETNLK